MERGNARTLATLLSKMWEVPFNDLVEAAQAEAYTSIHPFRKVLDQAFCATARGDALPQWLDALVDPSVRRNGSAAGDVPSDVGDEQ